MQMDFSMTVTGEENRHSAGVNVALESRLRELIVQGMARLAGPVSKVLCCEKVPRHPDDDD